MEKTTIHEHDTIGLVVQKDRRYKKVFLPLKIIGAISIYLMFVPVVILDISTQIYQFIYFGLHDIPKIGRKNYIVVDRQHLTKLNWLHKINCTYCGYMNGVLRWVQSVAAQTEIYSCAIKHWHPAKGQDNQKNFYSYRTFE